MGRPGWVQRWEDLHVGVQLGVTFAVALVAMFVLHVTLLNQPLGRGLGYAVFWAVIVTGVIVAATRAERARRLQAQAERERRRGRR